MHNTTASDIDQTCWQERYHASDIYTLRCKILDRPGMLGQLISAIGQTQAHVGSIHTVGIESQSKIRDIQVFCCDRAHLDRLLAVLANISAVEVLQVKDDVLEIHHRGAINIVSRVPITNLTDLRMLYTPGVASVCQRIIADPASVRELTGIGDRVAIVTNGTAVLGLGNIGVMASLPVMEGKAAIFSEFAKISALPILIDKKNPDEIVEAVCSIAQSFGAIQLEDIAAPACFEIEEKLRARLDIPVFHDDQHGTATVALAALINGLKRCSRNIEECRAIIVGAGAAGYAITTILLKLGIKDIVVYDSSGPLYRGRETRMNAYKRKLAEMTNKTMITGDLLEGFRGRDIFIGVAQPKMVSQEMIRAMAEGPVVFPLSNPIGEITVEEAYEAGAAVVADGRVINNALAYPGLFRGALDVQAGDITTEMQLAAAHQLASMAGNGMLLPDILDRQVHSEVARAVSQAWLKTIDRSAI